MNRKYTKQIALTFLITISSSFVHADNLTSLSNQDASNGLKAALEKGAAVATSRLGVADGFLNNEKVKIKLPSILEKAKPILKMSGKSGQLDELVVSMNRAAEAAVPLAKPLLLDAVKNMSVTDAKNILTGGDSAVTDFFKDKTSQELKVQFLPSVKKITDRSGLSTKYNNVMANAKKFGSVSDDEATVESYVNKRAVDGLYLMIAEEEKKIRQDPVGAGSKIIGKVFGLIK